MKFEFVVTDGSGTLMDFGTAKEFCECTGDFDTGVYEDCITDIIFAAIGMGYSIQAEPCPPECTTGE